MPPDIEGIAEQVFTALADPTRRSILAALAAGSAGPMSTPGPGLLADLATGVCTRTS